MSFGIRQSYIQSPLAKHVGHSHKNVLVGDTTKSADALYTPKAAHIKPVKSTFLLRVHGPGFAGLKSAVSTKAQLSLSL